MIDIKKVQEEAQAEITEERTKKAKEKIKDLLRKKAQAEQVVKNIERELTDLYAQIGEGTLI
jgi:hypothetical protein